MNTARSKRLWKRLEHAMERVVSRRIRGARPAPTTHANGSSRSPLGPGGEISIEHGVGRWQETGAPGVRCKVLFEDPSKRRRTALYQMDPGASYPPHIHGGVEECFVLSGDLIADAFEMHEGDYQRMPDGSEHGRQWSRLGCLLFVRCSTEDVHLDHTSGQGKAP